MKPLISLITGTYNRISFLRDMLESFKASFPSSIGFEVVICDGGSTDGTLAWLKSPETIKEYNIVLIEHGELKGAIMAFNDCARAAAGDYLLVANDDIQFIGNTVLRGLGFILGRPDVGAACFYQDRAGKEFHVEQMTAEKDGQKYTVPYLQVGLIPRWLWLYCGGWGDFGARTYGGDNYLTAKVLEAGYKVEAAPETKIHDRMPHDELRRINNEVNDGGKDGQNFYRVYPDGVRINDVPQVENPLPRQGKILIATIFESYNVQKDQKRGLRDALKKHGVVVEIDHLAGRESIGDAAEAFHPDISILQLHDASHISEVDSQLVRTFSGAVMSWSGDVWETQATPEYLKLIRDFDFHGTINCSLMPKFEEKGIPVFYIQNSFEPGILEGVCGSPCDVLFQGNNYGDYRLDFVKKIKAICDEVHCLFTLYGNGYPLETGAVGDTLYNFRRIGENVRGAKIVIGDNQFPDHVGFCSDRFFMSLAAGGAMLMHQHVVDLEKLTGFKSGVHYVEWFTMTDLKEKMAYYLSHEDERQAIAAAGTKFCREEHNFDKRATEILEKFKQVPKRGYEISTMIICKNEEKFILKAISQATRFSSEVVVVDTGSTDATVEMIKRANNEKVRLHEITWSDDFSAARNAAKEFCSKPWVFWMDCDDEIEERTLKSLENFRKWDLSKHGTTAFHAVKFTVIDDFSQQSVMQCRLLRNIKAIKFREKIHETVDGSLTEVGIAPIEYWAGVIHHAGNLDEGVRAAKQIRNIRILNTYPDSPWKLYHVANSLCAMGKYADAILCYDSMLIEWGDKMEPEFVQYLWFAKGYSYNFLGYKGLAAKSLRKSTFPDAYYLRYFIENNNAKCLEEFISAPVPGDIPSFKAMWLPDARARLKTYFEERLKEFT